jgi:putative SOS response-associated peptidase YedK
MCGRYALYSDADTLAARFGLSAAADIRPRYNIAPSQEIPAIRCSPADGGRALGWLRWGLVPPWAESLATGYSMINARAETVADKPAFLNAFRHRRCLIPADGYYEWQQTAGGKQPYYIHLEDRAPMAFAGLWETWRDPRGKPLESCAIIVIGANARLRAIHDRMPVILPPHAYERWLAPDSTDPAGLTELLLPYPAEALEAYPIGTRVNNPGNEGPGCLEPLHERIR